ncbi:MAG: N-6 DNA methylase, partial [Clostridiales bacterium]|nr:N-6 DNA methylase [Clostridiales bacterium]
EDSGLLPPNSISRIIERFEILKREDSYKPLYDIFKQYFGYMNIGRKGISEEGDIPPYNGGLFYEDGLLDDLIIDDEILIIDLLNLSKYDFNTEVDVNILGHIFEHSLTEIDIITSEIKGTSSRVSKRKKEGVFYTPKYITQYIVENTIGKQCSQKREILKIENIEFDDSFKTKTGLSVKGKSLYQKLVDYKEWLLSLKIIDPACGSGAFLNQSLNFLIQEHKNIDNIIADLTDTPLRLFDTEKSILENNLYGVDINEESVEIAKLSLWIRTANKGKKLSVLSSNIKCGNSLIDDQDIGGEKSFNWNIEFPEIMDNGGFDVVIGNPPYVLCQPSNTSTEILEYYKGFEVASYKIDLFHLFFEKSISILKRNGKLGFITPNTYLTNKYIKPLREFILTNSSIDKIVNHNEPVFSEASVDVATIILNKSLDYTEEIEVLETGNEGLFKFLNKKDQKDWINDVDKIFNTKDDFKIKFNGCIPLIDICNSYFGIQAYDRKSSISSDKENEDYLPIIDGGDIFPYQYSIPTKYFNFIDDNIKSGGDYKVYNEERIVIRQIGKFPIVGMCKKGILSSNTLYNINLNNSDFDLKYVLPILNSSLIKSYWISMYSDGKKLFPKIKGYQLKTLPIKNISKELQGPYIKKSNDLIDLNDQIQNKISKFMGRLNDNFEILKTNKKITSFYEYEFKELISELKKQKNVISLPQQDEWEDYFSSYKLEINNLQSLVNKTYLEIDQMIYNLYELTDEEIGIIENNNLYNG